MSRRELREHIFRLLFRIEFHSAEEMQEQIDLYLNKLEEETDEDKAYICGKYGSVAALKEEIDKAIDSAAIGWKVSRMGKVELTLLRLAFYEMKYDDKVPVSVAINEAIELSKKYGGDESPAFINGVLAKLVAEV